MSDNLHRAFVCISVLVMLLDVTAGEQAVFMLIMPVAVYRFAAAALLASIPGSHHTVGSSSPRRREEGIVETVKGYEDLVVQWGADAR